MLKSGVRVLIALDILLEGPDVHFIYLLVMASDSFLQSFIDDVIREVS